MIHLAAKISVDESIKNPSETFQTNVEGTKNVLIACKKNQIKKIIASSSAAVYGESKVDVKLTEKSKIKPLSTATHPLPVLHSRASNQLATEFLY